jgi:succinate dehydrogenase/fumarate reductase cytochrome b subunit
MIKQSESLPPNLFESRGPRLRSQGWIPRSAAGRVGGLLFGFVFAAGGLCVAVATIALKSELRNSIASPVIAFIVCVLAVSMALAVAFFFVFVGVRILMGSFGSTMTPQRKTSLRKGSHV